MIQLVKLLFIVSLFSIFSGCGGSGSAGNDIIENGDQLQVNLVLQDSFEQEADTFLQGEEIKFILNVFNPTNEAITLNFNDTQQFDFVVTSSTGEEQWRWSSDKGFNQVLTTLTIAAQETIQISGVWDQLLSNDENIDVGSYTASGSLLDKSPVAEFDFLIQ